MKLNDREHYELMEFFDRQFKHLRLDKETKELWSKSRIYQNDDANKLFLAFRDGVAYGQLIARVD